MKNFNKNKSNLRKNLEKQPYLANVVAREKDLNRFAPSILSVFPDSYKEWKYGQHLILKNNKSYKAYCTSYSDYSYFDEKIKENLHKNGTQAIIYLDNLDHTHLKIVTAKKTYHIFQFENYYIINGEKREFLKEKTINGYSKVSYFQMISLVSQCVSIVGPEARRLGNIKSNQNSTAQGRRCKNLKCILTSDYAEKGETICEMNAKGAYEVAKKWGYSKTYKSFRIALHKGEIRFEAKSSYLVINLLLEEKRVLTHNNSNSIIRDEEKNLNLGQISSIIVGKNPQQAVIPIPIYPKRLTFSFYFLNFDQKRRQMGLKDFT